MCRIRLFALVMFLIVACSTVAQQQPDSPSAAVGKYCQLDLDGARTQSATFHKVDHMVLWHTEPGWDMVRLVRTYKIVSVRTTSTRSVVTVEYDVIGDVDGGEQLTKKSHKERVLFTLELGDKEWAWRDNNPVLVKRNRAWRIKSPVICPHISVEYAIQHFSSLLNDQPSEDQVQLRRVIAELKAIQMRTTVR